MATVTFAAPIWLVLLIPWTAALVWALIGRVAFARVPAIFLWDRTPVEQTQHRQLRRPPAWVIWMLAAALLGILCASGLGVHWPWAAQRAVVIVDCGLSMSADRRVADAIRDANLHAVRIICVPGPMIESDTGIPTDRLSFTAAPTRDLLQRTVRTALAEHTGRVYVVTDQPMDVIDDRLALLRPTKPLDNVAITLFAVTEHAGAAQAMVRVQNDSSHTSARLVVDRVSQTIELPPRGTGRDYFVNLPAVGSAVSARVEVEDDIAADNAAWVMQRRGWPRVEARSGLSPAMTRMIEVYNRQRPPGETSRTISVIEGFFNLPDAIPAVAVAPVGGGQPLDPSRPVRVEFDHPLTRNVNWPRLIDGARAHAGPGDGWVSIVAQDDRVLVATRQLEDGVRQVWVGLDAPDFALRPDFVVFFTNVFDYLGESTGGYARRPAGTLGRTYKPLVVADQRIEASPGLYRRSDGDLTAVAAEPITGRITHDPAFPRPAAPRGGVVPLAGPLLLAALACCVVGLFGLTRI